MPNHGPNLLDNQIVFSSPRGGVEMAYRFDTRLPKPCVHPLITPSGVTLTAFEPADHVWHRGLWYAIKFINGSNFWEENPLFGSQISEDQPTYDALANGAGRVGHALRWESEATGPVIAEARTITSIPPNSEGVSIIDWSSKLQALADLTLDRTPFTTWGGYGGLTFRGSLALHDVSYELPDGKPTRQIIGESYPWIILRASAGSENKQISLGMIDHPRNPRSPISWYCKSEPGYAFACAAFLFHGPMTVKRGEALHIRHRIAYRDGAWKPGEFAKIAKQFLTSASFND